MNRNAILAVLLLMAVVGYILIIYSNSGVPFGSNHHPERSVSGVIAKARSFALAAEPGDPSFLLYSKGTPEFTEFQHSVVAPHSKPKSLSARAWILTVTQSDEPLVFVHDLSYYPDTGEVGDRSEWYFVSNNLRQTVLKERAVKTEQSAVPGARP